MESKDPLLNERLLKLLDDPNVKEFMLIVNDSAYKQPQVKRQTDVEAELRKIRDSHTEVEVKVALEWVVRFFGSMIRYDPKTEAPRIWFANFSANEQSRARGWTNSSNGFIIGRSMRAERFALYYIDVILDETIRDDEAKIWAIIEYSKEHAQSDAGMMHPELLFLIGESNGLEMWIHGDEADSVR